MEKRRATTQPAPAEPEPETAPTPEVAGIPAFLLPTIETPPASDPAIYDLDPASAE
jgi:hypothetical protein